MSAQRHRDGSGGPILLPTEVRPLLDHLANTGLRTGTELATEIDGVDFAERRVL